MLKPYEVEVLIDGEAILVTPVRAISGESASRQALLVLQAKAGLGEKATVTWWAPVCPGCHAIGQKVFVA